VEGKAMSKWFDLNEKFPEESKYVKVKGHFPFEVTCEFVKTPLGHFFIKKPSETDFCRIEIYGVTHWKDMMSDKHPI
jgi:hypothetical protein